MKVILQDGKIVECNADEFQQIYPTIMNGHTPRTRISNKAERGGGTVPPPLSSDNQKHTPTHRVSGNKTRKNDDSIAPETFDKFHKQILERFPTREFTHGEVAEALQISKSSLHRYFNVAVEKNLLVKLKPALYQVNQSSHKQSSHREITDKSLVSKETPQEPTPSLSSNPRDLGSNNATKNVSLSRKALVMEQTQKMYPEMYKQIVLLFESNNDLSYSRIRKQFRNVTADVVDDFISIALKTGQLKSIGAETYMLSEAEAEVPAQTI